MGSPVVSRPPAGWGSSTPMRGGAGTEWSPACGVSWQVVHVPWMVATPRSSFSPETPVMGLPDRELRSARVYR